ncbi:MAG: putative zinc-binding protein [Victivallales bacterium]
MVDLPEIKAGIVACSGEELAEGTVTRLAALKVLHELRPNNTVTICLPLFLAGGEDDRTFARFHPTITVDGCELRCAARATEMHSGKPAASIVVTELVAELGLSKPEGRRHLNEAGKKAVDATSRRLAELVDKVLGKEGYPISANTTNAADAKPAERQVTCSCGSGIPVTKIVIDGKTIEVLALPLIFKKFRDAGRKPDSDLVREILETAKIYNPVPPEAEGNYRKAILAEYTKLWNQEGKP